MQLQEYTFIYNDLKQQLKEIPALQNLLRMTQKSTRKLQCINLYSISDKRQFDLELEESQIMNEIAELWKSIQAIDQHSQQSDIRSINQSIESIKQKNMEMFDLLSRQDELLTLETEKVQFLLNEEHDENQIREEDQYEQENLKDSSNPYDNTQRVQQLKKEIEDISNKISKINNGKGKWYETDHKDFVKIYNRFAGNDSKIIEQGIKVLGMNNTEIVDHLELYESYLQLEKEKKLISEEYKQIKMMEKMEEEELKSRKEKITEDKLKDKKQKLVKENEKKKQMVQIFKEKRQLERVKMIEEQERKDKEKLVKVPVPIAKKKQIIERNQKYILDKQNSIKKQQQKLEQKANQLLKKNSFSKGKSIKANEPKQIPKGVKINPKIPSK